MSGGVERDGGLSRELRIVMEQPTGHLKYPQLPLRFCLYPCGQYPHNVSIRMLAMFSSSSWLPIMGSYAVFTQSQCVSAELIGIHVNLL